MEYTYMVVAFIENFKINDIVEPPKHVHITIKKKFKLLDINKEQLVSLLENTVKDLGEQDLKLGNDKEYDDPAFMVIEVLNSEDWKNIHLTLMKVLSKNTESRDPHFEGENYLPHVSWKVKNEITLDPKPFYNTSHNISELYLIERNNPVISRVRVVAKLPLL